LIPDRKGRAARLDLPGPEPNGRKLLDATTGEDG
jgi:hypothetical protein